MQSERIQQRIDRLLAEADEAVAESDWARVRDRAENVLRFDAENGDALAYLAASDRQPAQGAGGGGQRADLGPPGQTPSPTAVGEGVGEGPKPVEPTLSRQASVPKSFVNGRYQVAALPGRGR